MLRMSKKWGGRVPPSLIDAYLRHIKSSWKCNGYVPKVVFERENI